MCICHPVRVYDSVRTIFPAPLTIFNQTWYGGVSLRGKLSGRKKMVHYRQCQGHSEGLYNQNMTIFTIFSKLLVHLQLNLG